MMNFRQYCSFLNVYDVQVIAQSIYVLTQAPAAVWKSGKYLDGNLVTLSVLIRANVSLLSGTCIA